MNVTSAALAWLLVLPVCLAALGCERFGQAQPKPSQDPAPSASHATPPKPASPAVAEPQTRELAGDLRPLQAANLSFKVGGKLATIRVARGQKVKAGQVLASLSDAEARAALAQAEAAVRAARAQAALADDAQSRAQHLVDAKAVPDSTGINAKLSAQTAQAAVGQAEAAATLARVNLSNHVLSATFDGVVVSVPEGVGAIVGPGIPLFRLERLDVLVLHTTASEADLPYLQVDGRLKLQTTSGQEAEGRVRAVLASLDGISRRAPVEIEVPNKEGRLAAGAYVRALLPLTPPTPSAAASVSP